VTTPISPNSISLNDVQTEFGGSNPIEIVEYYAGGTYVPVSVAGIPTSGQISLNDFYNKTKTVYQFTSATMSRNIGIAFTSVISWTATLPAGGYVTLYIVYPNNTSSTLSNLGTSSSSNVSFTQSTGVGGGTVYLFGYNSANTLLASKMLTYTVVQQPVINSIYFSPTPVVAGVTAFALYWSVSYATSIQYNIILPSGGRITDTITNLNSNSGQFITYTAGTLTGEVAALTEYGSVATSISTTVVPQPTYTFTRSVANVDEGGSFTISFSTNQTGNFAYTITGVNRSDINNASLTGTVTNGSSIGYSVTADEVADGFKTFIISLDNGLASTSVGINDTSTAPIPPTISGLTVSDTNPYPSTAITISWNTTNAVTSSTILLIIFPSGGYYQFTNMSANSRTFGGYSFDEIGVHTVYVIVYSSSGQSASANTTFTVKSAAVIPTITASVSPASAPNTDGVTISWSTTNTSSVAITMYFPGGSSTTASGYSANGNTPIGPSTSLPTGSYSAVLTATSSTGNTATTTVYWTFTAAAVFTATFTGSLKFPNDQLSRIVYINNDNIAIYARGASSITYYGISYYTTNMAGYIAFNLNTSTEANYDFGIIYFDGEEVGRTSGSSSLPIAKRSVPAGSHSIMVAYQKDGSINGLDDAIVGIWTWSAT
jgi:hypothetical protein